MRALVDTCVIIDALQSRKPFAAEAEEIFLLAANQSFSGYVTAKAMTDIYYLTHHCTHDISAARKIVSGIAVLFDILDTTERDVRLSLSSGISDFEDAVMIETAIRTGVDCIVTRNEHDYRSSPVMVYTPSEFLQALNSPENEQ